MTAAQLSVANASYASQTIHLPTYHPKTPISTNPMFRHFESLAFISQISSKRLALRISLRSFWIVRSISFMQINFGVHCFLIEFDFFPLCSILITRRALPPTSYLLPPTSYLLPPTSYLLPCSMLSSSNGQPKAAYTLEYTYRMYYYHHSYSIAEPPFTRHVSIIVFPLKIQ